jgi:hypothetical protein
MPLAPSSAHNFSLSGTMGIHFDENLKRVGPFR